MHVCMYKYGALMHGHLVFNSAVVHIIRLSFQVIQDLKEVF